MAEIELQEKKKPIWPWIIALIIAALLIWALVSYFNNNDKDDVADSTQPTVSDTINRQQQNNAAINNNAVAEYINWANSGDNESMGLEHDYTANGLRRLAEAIEDVANRKFTGDAEVSSAVNAMKASADQIQVNKTSTQHANEIKAAFLASVNALDKMLKQTHEGLRPQIEELRRKANAIDKQTLTLEQKSEVKNFFMEAGHVLAQVDRP